MLHRLPIRLRRLHRTALPPLVAGLLLPPVAAAQPDPREVIAGAEEIRPDDAVQLAAEVGRLFAAEFPADRPGAAVVVTRDGEALLRQGYGLSGPGAEAVMDPARPFPLGSLAEPFTAAAVLLLAEEGKLSLDAPAADLLPAGSPPLDRRITLHHLLSHTSGLTDDAPPAGVPAPQDPAPAGRLEPPDPAPPAFAPGQRWQLSEANRRLLAAILEQVSGEAYGQLIAERIFRPLGMAGSAAGPAAGLSSSLDDLARFAAALSAGRLLSPQSRRLMWTSATLADGRPVRYGYGWAVWDYLGHRVLEQEGGGGSLVLLPDDGLVAAALARPDAPGRPAQALALAAATRLVRKPIDDPLGVLLLPEVLDEYLGVYASAADPGELWVVTRTGLQVFIAAPGGERKPALAARKDELFYPGEAVRITFQRDGKGQVDRLVVSRGRGPDEVAEKRPVVTLGEAD